MVHFVMDAVAGARRTPGRHKTGSVSPPAAVLLSLAPFVLGLRFALPEALRRHSGQLLRQRDSTLVKTLRRLWCRLLRQRQTQQVRRCGVNVCLQLGRRQQVLLFLFHTNKALRLSVTPISARRSIHVPGQVRGRHSGIQDGIREVDLDWSATVPELAQRLSKSHLRALCVFFHLLGVVFELFLQRLFHGMDFPGKSEGRISLGLASLN